jgi:hypothetical protein
MSKVSVRSQTKFDSFSGYKIQSDLLFGSFVCKKSINHAVVGAFVLRGGWGWLMLVLTVWVCVQQFWGKILRAALKYGPKVVKALV